MRSVPAFWPGRLSTSPGHHLIAGSVLLALLAALLVLVASPSSAGAAPFSRVLDLNGGDAYATVADNPSLTLGADEPGGFTIEAWIYVPDESGSTNQVIVYQQGAYALSINFHSVSDDTISLRLWYSTSGSTTLTSPGLDIAAGWHHIAGVYENNALGSNDLAAIYLDGTRIAYNSSFSYSPGINNPSNTLSVGANSGAVPFYGYFDELRLSDTVRYATSTYTVPSAPFTADSNTRALWHFDDSYGATSFADSSGNGNTLAGHGGAMTILPGGLPEAPTITGTTPASPSNNNFPKVYGTVGGGSPTIIKIFKNTTCSGVPYTSAITSDFTGAGIMLSVSSDATTDLSAIATNTVGDSACSAPTSYVEDSTAPVAPIISGSSPGSPSTVNDPRLTGTAEAGSTVSIYTTADCSGSPVATGSAATFASPGISVAVASDSTTDFRAVATDQVGNRSPCSAAYRYVEDSTPPDTMITSGPSGPTNQRTVSFTVTATEVAAQHQCSIDGGAFHACASTVTTSLADGAHTFQVRAVDAAGNVDGSPAARSFVIDTVAPDTTISKGPSGLTKLSRPTFEFRSSHPSVRYVCSLDGSPFRSCSSPYALPKLRNGKHTLVVRAIDSAGNADTTPATRSFTVDTIAPNTKITKGPAAKTRSRTPTFAFKSTEARSKFACSLDGKRFQSCKATFKAPKLGYGKHTLRVRATDAAGNTDPTPAARTFRVVRH